MEERPKTQCKKVKFATERDAIFYIGKLQKTSTREVKPIRAYQCWCGAWHLSSKLSIAEANTQIEAFTKQVESLKGQLELLQNPVKKEQQLKLKAMVNADKRVIEQQKRIAKCNEIIRTLKLRIDNYGSAGVRVKQLEKLLEDTKQNPRNKIFTGISSAYCQMHVSEFLLLRQEIIKTLDNYYKLNTNEEP